MGKIDTESIEQALYIEYENVKGLRKATEDWVRLFYDSHFKISDIEEKFGDKDNNQVKQLIILSVRDGIYCKSKTCREMTLGDLKRCLQKKSKNNKITRNNDQEWRHFFYQRWNTFSIEL